MKPTFLNQARPLITSMILKDNPDSIRYEVKNSICDGADCLGIQLECLKKEFKNEEIYKSIVASCGGRPIYVTNYRLRENLELSDDEIGEELLKALACGATLGDVPGSLYDSESKIGESEPVCFKVMDAEIWFTQIHIAEIKELLHLEAAPKD